MGVEDALAWGQSKKRQRLPQLNYCANRRESWERLLDASREGQHPATTSARDFREDCDRESLLNASRG